MSSSSGIADFFDIDHDGDPSPDDPISITREEFDDALRRLEEVGTPIEEDREQAWTRELLTLAPLVVLTIFFGVYPAPILDIFGASVESIIKPLNEAAAAAQALALASLQ